MLDFWIYVSVNKNYLCIFHNFIMSFAALFTQLPFKKFNYGFSIWFPVYSYGSYSHLTEDFRGLILNFSKALPQMSRAFTKLQSSFRSDGT